MMNTAKTLLDSDHPPSLEELQNFFKENDWTGIKILDEKSVSSVSLETINLNKAVFSPFLESAMKEHGLGAGIKNFDNKVKVDGISFQQNSLVDFGENFKNTVSTLVEKWQRESPDTSQKTIEYYRAKGIDEDDFLGFYTALALDVTQFDKAAGVIRKNSADEDFNPHKANNFRAMDHRRKWNHTRDKIKLELCPDPDLINNNLLIFLLQYGQQIISEVVEENKPLYSSCSALMLAYLTGSADLTSYFPIELLLLTFHIQHQKSLLSCNNYPFQSSLTASCEFSKLMQKPPLLRINYKTS